jgi:NhaP-type Na+/H+ or K+/H+ antiporter
VPSRPEGDADDLSSSSCHDRSSLPAQEINIRRAVAHIPRHRDHPEAWRTVVARRVRNSRRRYAPGRDQEGSTVNQYNLALLTIGGIVLCLGLISGIARRQPLPLPPLAVAVGVVLGGRVFGVLDAGTWREQSRILEEAARITLAIGLMGVALRLPQRYYIRRAGTAAVLLGPLMAGMWVTSGLIVYVVTDLPFWVAMLTAAVVTPTDPVVASTIVTGRVAEENLPATIRNAISAESGANDGLAYPFVVLSILLLRRSTEDALHHWATRVVVWEVGFGVLAGAAVGYAAGRLLRWSKARALIEESSLLASSLALSLVLLAAARLIGTNGILAVFTGGLAFAQLLDDEDRTKLHRAQEAANRFFILPVFVLFGVSLPWDRWMELGWRGLVVVGAILVLRRLPMVLALRPLLGKEFGVREALFVGWFGPIGVGGIYYGAFANNQTGNPTPWVLASLIVCGSLMAHGLSGVPLTRWYVRMAEATREQASKEDQDASRSDRGYNRARPAPGKGD